MFESLQASKPDAILSLMLAFREDERAHKLDLGVGVYKDEAGQTPVMQAITTAEKRVLDEQTTKAYIGPAGSAAFNAAMIEQVFGGDADTRLIRSAQSIGGSGAIRVLADLLKVARPDASVWVSDPDLAEPRAVARCAAGFTVRIATRTTARRNRAWSISKP